MHHKISKPKRVLFLLIPPGLVLILLSICRNAGKIAAETAENALRFKINQAVSDTVGSERYSGADFIRIEKNSAGEITAIISDMTLINELSSEVLDSVRDCGFRLGIPLGSLSGLRAFAGKGPAVPLELKVLDSSAIENENSAAEAEGGRCFRICLSLSTDAEISIPWHRELRQFKTNIIIAEAVVFSADSSAKA